MKTKRIISLLLAVLLTLSVAVTPAFAASAGDLLPAAESADVEESNDVVSIRLTTSGELVYGSPFTLSVVTKPADTQYIGVVIGTKGEAKGYVTLVLSDKIRTLLKMIPLPRKMSATPDQAGRVQPLCLPQAAHRRQRRERAAAGGRRGRLGDGCAAILYAHHQGRFHRPEAGAGSHPKIPAGWRLQPHLRG